MSATYEPLKDPVADGYTFVGATVDLTADDVSKPDWKEPLWAKFKAFCWGFGKAAAIIALFLGGVLLYQRDKEHAETIKAIQTAPVALPELTKPSIFKPKPIVKPANPKAVNTTDNVASEPINTKATPTAKIIQPIIIDPFSAELASFDKLVLNFESKL